MEIFIGLDVSLASTSVCALNANGETVNEAKVPSDPGSLVAHMRELPGSVVAVGLEAGPQSQWLHKGLSEAGFETVLMETRRVKSSLKAAPVKTDRRDAEGIAQLLRMGWFQPVHCKSVASQEKRALLTSRSALVEGLTRLELSVRGILRNFGLKLGRVSKGRWEERVRELTADNAMLSDAVGPILRLRAQMRDELAMMTKKVRNLALSDATCRQLMTMPGVGPVTALAFVTAVDDPSRFRRARDIGAWAGLTPRRSQSGERDVSGEITRAGDTALRTALFQAATTMLHNGKRMSWLKAWALRVAGRRGQKRATTALARRMGVVLLRMWPDGTEFRFAREAAMSPDPA